MHAGVIEQLTGDATLEDLQAAAWDIGCTISGNEIVYHTTEQAARLQLWMTEHGFGQPQEVH